MKFRTSSDGIDFEIPDDWWAFAEMDGFKCGDGACYYYGNQPNSELAQVVDLSCVEPPTRNAGIPAFRKYKLMPVLFAFTSPECSLPPVAVTSLHGGQSYCYRVTNGFHRYYASVAVGYRRLPVVIQDAD